MSCYIINPGIRIKSFLFIKNLILLFYHLFVLLASYGHVCKYILPRDDPLQGVVVLVDHGEVPQVHQPEGLHYLRQLISFVSGVRLLNHVGLQINILV